MLDQFREIPEGSVVYLNTDTRNYFEVIVELMRHFTGERGMEGVYTTATRPAPAIIDQMQVEGIPLGGVYFVDAVSYLVGTVRRDVTRTVYVESPTMLETVMLKTDFFIKRLRTEDRFALFDSISGLSIYNDDKMVQEFIHILTNTMRIKDINTVLLTVKEQTSPGMDSMLRLNCDDTIEVGEARTGPGPRDRGHDGPGSAPDGGGGFEGDAGAANGRDEAARGAYGAGSANRGEPGNDDVYGPGGGE